MTQCERVIDYLEKNRNITQKEAESQLGIMRLASRISDLKGMGYIIHRDMIEVQNRYGEKNHVARYTMIGKADNERENVRLLRENI